MTASYLHGDVLFLIFEKLLQGNWADVIFPLLLVCRHWMVRTLSLS
jgi:hypothetical protein